MNKVINVIIRKTGEKTVVKGEGSLSVSVSAPSVIEIQTSAQDVTKYIRQGNDLFIYMEEGSVIRCTGYFDEDPESGKHSELILQDENGLTHITFIGTDSASELAATELVAQPTSVQSIEPFLDRASDNTVWGWAAGAAIASGVIGALLSRNDHHTSVKEKIIDNTQEIEITRPTFTVADDQGERQGILSSSAITDDNTPVFSGTGHPGATIQIKDSSGNTIASTMVTKEGTWNVKLDAQPDGTHHWSVVQIQGDKTLSAGDISLSVTTQQAALAIETISGDNVINAAEQAAGFTVSGTSTSLAEGSALTVTLNGKTYFTVVEADGHWHIAIPAGDAKALSDGVWTVNLSGQDVAGNTLAASQTLTVDTRPPSVFIDAVAQDNIINATEHNQPVTLSGKTDAEPGQRLTLTLEGKTLTTTVAEDGSWSVTLDANDVSALAHGEHAFTVSVSDRAGNNTTSEGHFSVDTRAPVVHIDTVSGDDMINAGEQSVAQIVSGRADGAAEGDTVTVKVGDRTFVTQVQAGGFWSVGVPSSVMSGLPQGSQTLIVTVTDAAGNSGSASHNITLIGSQPLFTFDAVSQDNVLNAREAMQPLTLSGTSNLPDGSAITVTLNHVSYAATVVQGIWSVAVPVIDVVNLADTLYTITVSGVDSAGNTGSEQTSLLVDTHLPQVVINDFAQDNLLNLAEVNSDQILSGRVTGAAPGDVITVSVNGMSYTATVGQDLNWSLTIPARDLQRFGDGELTITASVTNSHGNTGSAERDISINAQLPGLRVNNVSGDDVINAIEQHQDLTITGASTHLDAGTQLQVSVNGKIYQAVVGQDGRWQIGVSATDLLSWPAGDVIVSVNAVDKWGNPVSAERPVNVDLNDVAVTIDVISQDDLLNAAEKQGSLNLTGRTEGVGAGQSVVVKIDGQIFTAVVQGDGSWSLTLPPSALANLIDGRATISASVTNASGNSAGTARDITFDTQAPTIVIDALTADNILNQAEAGAALTVSGFTTAEAGQRVTVTLNGRTYTTAVETDGSWQLTVPAADLADLPEGALNVTASVSDRAGNTGTAHHTGQADLTVPAVSISAVAEDDIINAVEHHQPLVIQGAATGAGPGDRVTIALGDQLFTTVLDENGQWRYGLPANVVAGLSDGAVSIAVTVTDAAGNRGEATRDIVVSTVVPQVTVNVIARDDVINAIEKGQDLQLSGASNQPGGTPVNLTLNGVHYSALTGPDGSWQLTVPAADAAALEDTHYTVTAEIADAAGNSARSERDITLDSQAPTIVIDMLTADNVLNQAEAGAPLTVSGFTTAEAGQQVTVTLNGRTYTTAVETDGSWQLTVPAADLADLPEGALNVTASVSDRAGNSGTADRELGVDKAAPEIVINAVADDNIINLAEQQAGQIISGTTTAEAGQVVIITFNGQHYTAVVDSTGGWSVSIPDNAFHGLSDGDYVISASVSDKAGNQGSGNHNVSLKGDVPTISIDAFAQDDVVNAAEHGTPLIISGTTSAQPGQIVTITLNGNTYTTTVQNGGKWQFTLGSADVAALAEGSACLLYAEVTNIIGNSASDERVIHVDLTAPAMGISIGALQHDSGLSSSDFITNASPITVKGSLTAALSNDEKAQISLDGGLTWIDLVVNGKQWTYSDSRALTDGDYLYQVRVVDQAGNVGATDSQNVVVDLTAPAASGITIDAISQDNGLSASDFITNDNQLSLQGTLSAVPGRGEYVQISLDGGLTWIDVEVSGTSWTYVDGRTLADGDYNYMLRVIDDAGNISATASQLVTVDTVRPDIKNRLTVDGISDDSGLNNNDFITRDTSLTLRGSLGAMLKEGEFVQVSVDHGITWQNATVIGTSWYYTDGRELKDGAYDYWVRVTDLAGNITGSAQQQVTVDTTPPDAKQIAIESILNDTGHSNSDFLTNETSLTLTGSLDAPLGKNEFVQISVDGGNTWVMAEVNGKTWRYTDDRTLTEGEHAYQVRVVDEAGNVEATAEQVVTVDLTPPSTTATILNYTDDVGTSRGEFPAGTITDDRTPVLNGKLSAALAEGERVRIYDTQGALLGEAVVDGDRWHFAVNEPLSDGQQIGYQAVVVDAAGNEGAPSPVFTLTVSLNVEVKVQNTLDTTPIVTGVVDYEILDGEYVEVTINQVVYSSRTGAVVIDPDNNTWYVQIPQENALGQNTYDVEVVLYDEAGEVITRDKSQNELTVSPTASIDFTSAAASSSDTSTALTIGEDGTWRILSNSTVFTQNGTSASTLGSFSQTVLKGSDKQQQSSFIDFDRDGLMDILGADTAFGNGQQSFRYNPDGSYSAFQVGNPDNDKNGNVYVWFGGFMGIDINGDGYVDAVYGDETPNDADTKGGYDSTFVMNTNGTISGFDKSGAYVNDPDPQNGMTPTNTGNPTPDREVAGVDLNNDGYVDIVYHGTDRTNTTSQGGKSDANSRLVVVTNGVDAKGNTTLTNTQLITGVFAGDKGDDDYYTTLTWADLNGDGYMDLFVGGLTGQGGKDGAGSAIFYNDGQGNLTAGAQGVGTGASVQKLNDNVNSMTSLAVDWDGDGRVDLIEIAGAAGSKDAGNVDNIALLWLNRGVNASTGQADWTSQKLFSDANRDAKFVTGALSLDLDYDGDRDLVVFRSAGGATQYVENTSHIKNGTSIILRLSDANGINAFYGNTVLLVDESTGNVVASQMINPQGGVNMNDSSGLVYFYGLDAGKRYSAVLLANGQDYGGVASVTLDASGVTNHIENVNASWSGLKAIEKNHAYILTAENGDAAVDSALAATDLTNRVGIVGTGYNDTLYATAGMHIYNGGGGSRLVSGSNEWTAEGGADIVDYKLAGDAALKIDLSNNTLQETGFGTATFVNIEGIAGGGGNDSFTGSKSDNYFEGRGGNDIVKIGNGGRDTLLYKLLDASDATGGNGQDVVNGFTVGTWEGTADTDRIDLRELLSGSGYAGSGSASYVNGVATLADDIGNLSDYIRIVQNGSNTDIQIDRDGTGNQFNATTVLTLNGVQTDLATLLANHQLLIV